MARVYLGTLRGAVGFEKRLVVKQIRPELASDEAFVRRFIEEAKTAVELGHPNIVPVYELGVEQGIYYIAMELCEGVTLSELLRATGPLSADEGAYVGIEICRALDYAHRKSGIVHRDVTPRNVMVDEEGAVRLIDFGIAAPVTLDDDEPHEVFGSPGHMPPEQIQGGTLTPASDVFAVAALLVEAWSGKAPFRRASPVQCLEALNQPVKRIDEDAEALAPLAELIARALALDASQRPESAEALARPLRDFVKSSDLGDLARRLGGRVRDTRRQARASHPVIDAQDTETLAATPSTSSSAEHTPPANAESTRTFAARDELVEWTRKLPSIPPPGGADARDDDEDASDADRAGAGRGEDASATESAVVSAVAASDAAASAAARAEDDDTDDSARPPARVADKHASRDEDDASPTTSSQRRIVPQPSSRLGPALAVGAVALGVAAFFALRPPTPPETSATATAPAVSPRLTPSADAALQAPSPSPSPAPAPAPAPRPVPRPTLTHSAAAPSSPSPAPSALAIAGRGVLNLTSTPPALVSVDGRSRGTTPVMGIDLAAGPHSVQFKSPLLDERVPAQVTLGAGQTRTVHADFTAASPRVYVR